MAGNEQIFIGANALINQIKKYSSQIFNNNSLDAFATAFNVSVNNSDRIKFLIPEQYLEQLPGRLMENSSLLSNLMTGRGRNNGIITLREDLKDIIFKNFDDVSKYGLSNINRYFSSQTINENFSIHDLPAVEQTLHSNSAYYSGSAKHNTTMRHFHELEHMDVSLDLIKKQLLYFLHFKEYASFFWWLFLFALCQEEIIAFRDLLIDTQYRKVVSFFNKSVHSPVALEEEDFWELRKKIVKSAKGELFIAGSSLRDAFSRSHTHSIIAEIRDAIKKHQLSRINVFVTDPEVFDSPAPMRDISDAIQCLQENIYELANINQCELNIYFLSLTQIDHAVITEEFMMFRSTKLWNSGRSFKGNFMLYLADYYCPSSISSEYKAHRDYLRAVAVHSTSIFPTIDKPISPPSSQTALWYHSLWRSYLEQKNFKYISLYKLYEEQIKSFANSTWAEADIIGEILPGEGPGAFLPDLYNADTFLADDTQAVLLSYIKETEHLFNKAIEKHGHLSNKDGYCKILPSLDIGFPNNVQRLAGGFATGMVIVWKCGVNIVPVDATVNVCTSSVFKLNKEKIKPEWLNPDTGLQDFHNFLVKLSEKASKEKGFSFSFTSGNHFLMLAQEAETKDFYLVMHSSANELKKSYMGLYPVENNWYSKKIKTIYNDEHTRYFRYLKDAEAKYFIQMAQNFQGYNEQIHQWIAEQFNGGNPLVRENDDATRWMYHHYYMPTSQSIAIGAFAEPPGTQVPIFSAFGKPIFLFEIGADNWTVNLGGEKGRVSIIPHGWGQEFEQIRGISVKNADDPQKRNLVLHYGENSFLEKSVSSQEKIDSPNKHVRNFEDAQDFFRLGSYYMHGRITKVLNPILEYSSNTVKQKPE